MLILALFLTCIVEQQLTMAGSIEGVALACWFSLLYVAACGWFELTCFQLLIAIGGLYSA